MVKNPRVDRAAFAKNWPARARAAILHTISLAETIFTCARGFAVNSRIARVRMQAELRQRDDEIAKLREELRIKDAWISLINPKKRHHYTP